MRFYPRCILLPTGLLLALVCWQVSSLAEAAPRPLPEIRALLDQGREAEKQSRADEALRVYAQALQRAQERKDRAGEGAALVAQGRLLLFDQPARSQALCEQALPIYQELNDTMGQAESLFCLGNAASLLKKSEQALLRYDAAYQLYKADGKRSEQALTLLMKGNVYRDTGQPSKTLPYFEQALTLFQELDDKPRQVMTLINLSRSSIEMHDTAHGLTYLERARPLAQKLKDSYLESMIVHNMAGAYAYQGKNQQAIAMFQQALPLLEAGGDKTQIASCLDNLGLLTFHTGDYLKSLACLNHAVRLQQEAGDTSGLAVSLDMLAQNYSYLGQRTRALELALRAVRASEEGSNLRVKAQNRNNLGHIYGALGKVSEEKACVEQALSLFRKIDDQNGQAFSLYFLSDNRNKARDTAQAASLNVQARQLFQKTKDQDGEAATWLQSGDLALESGRLAEALDSYRHALTLFQIVSNAHEEAIVLVRIGALKESQGDLTQAEQFYEQALQRQEALRASLGNLTTTKSLYQEKKFPLYQHYIEILLRAKHDARAFAWAQRSKARALVDLMEADNSNAMQALEAEEKQEAERLKRRDKELSQQWFAAMGDLNDLQRQAKPEVSRLQKAKRQARQIRQQQQRLEADWSAFQEQCCLHNPRLARQGSARTVTLEETASFLPEDTALLEYVVIKTGPGKADQEVVLFLVTQQGGKARLNICRLKTELRSLAQMAQAFRSACAGRPDTLAARPYQALARSLYRLLIAPAEAALRGKRRLIFCPDGPLWDIPFQALLIAPSARPAQTNTSPAEFLWERYALSYAYSATEVKAALALPQRPNRPKTQQSLLVMANPDFGPSDASEPESKTATSLWKDEAVRGLYSRAGGLRALPYTRFEAKAILESFPNATLKTGGDAQEAWVKRTGGSYRYLHFATHAVFNDAAPMMSGIVLARPPKDSSEDGILTVHELFDLNLGAEMLVLSACDTARGANQQGEGLIGLTWAAFAAGVPTQVVSQWAVDDEATARLMGGFYQGLKQGKTKDAALRQAALTLMRDGKHPHPFYWAPFLLMGDWH